MPTAKLKQKRKLAREACEGLFPRGERGVKRGPAASEWHVSKADFRRLAGKSPAEAVEQLQG